MRSPSAPRRRGDFGTQPLKIRRSTVFAQHARRARNDRRAVREEAAGYVIAIGERLLRLLRWRIRIEPVAPLAIPAPSAIRPPSRSAPINPSAHALKLPAQHIRVPI